MNRAEAYAQLGKTKEANNDLTKLMKAIQDERAKELFMEGFRLSDLKRWNLGFERTPQTGTIDGSLNNSLKIEKGNPAFIWPIPKHELDASMGLVKPNESNK